MMIRTVAKVAQALAVWQAVEADANQDNLAEAKAQIAMVHEEFIRRAYELAFDLVRPLLNHDKEITTRTEARYSAVAGGGGFVLQKRDLDPDNPGEMLTPDLATENFLQLVVDLPDILEALDIK